MTERGIAEVLHETKTFTQEQREALEKQGYVIYTLTGQSIKSLREAGRRFWSTWHRGEPIEELTSIRSEVAINPNKLFLPKSNNKTLSQQEKMVAQHSARLAKKIKGVEAILGEAPDYIELVFAHLDVTGQGLFGKDYDHNYARTKTPTVDSFVAGVGNFRAGDGLCVGYWDRDYDSSCLLASPLVVPK